MKLPPALFLVFLTYPLLAQSQANAKHLDIYWIDVEGGASTLIVAPDGKFTVTNARNAFTKSYVAR